MAHLPRSVEKLIAKLEWREVNNYGFYKNCYRRVIKLNEVEDKLYEQLTNDCEIQKLESLISKYYKELNLKTFSMCTQDRPVASAKDKANKVMTLLVVDATDYEKVQQAHNKFKRCSDAVNIEIAPDQKSIGQSEQLVYDLIRIS